MDSNISIYPNDASKNSEYKLLELSDLLRMHFEEKGLKNLVFRGCLGDDLMIFTDEHSFLVKETRLSSNLLLQKVENHNQSNIIVGILDSIYEAKRVKPRFERLLEIIPLIDLAKCNIDQKITIEKLLESVQSSEKELQIGLDYYNCFEFNNSYFRISETDLYKVTLYILTGLAVNGDIISLDTIDMNKHGLTLYPVWFSQSIVRKIYTETKIRNTSQITYKLNKSKVFKIFATNILKKKQEITRNELNKLLKENIPFELDNIESSSLKDTCCTIVEDSTITDYIRYINKYKLSKNLKTRIKELFSLQWQWTKSDFSGFLENIVIEGDIGKTLLNYCRVYNDRSNTVELCSCKFSSLDTIK